MNNVKNSIGWADFTWNPVTGCKRGCSYCYARRIHERFYKTPFSDIIMHSERLAEKMPKEPSRIFVGSMTDNVYWDVNMWSRVINVCKANPQHTFMFLSKDALAYSNVDLPNNCMAGLTLVQIREASDITAIDCLTSSNQRSFLSIEPILGEIISAEMWYEPLELVIVGAMTGAGALKPRPEWIQSVKDNVPVNKIYWKSNIKKYL